MDEQIAKNQSRLILGNQNIEVSPTAVYKPIEGDLIYKYSAKKEHHDQNIGYVEEGVHRPFSTAATVPGINPFPFSNASPKRDSRSGTPSKY